MMAMSSKETESRVPARAREKATPWERVDEIMGLMGTDDWSAATCNALMAKHGVSRATIERDASEAGRTLERLHAGTAEQRQEARGQLLVRLAHWRDMAKTRKKSFVVRTGKDMDDIREIDDPDMATIARLEDIAGKVLGAYAPVQIELGRAGEFSAMSTAELIVKLLRDQPELGEVVAKMLAAGEPAKEVIDVGTGEEAGADRLHEDAKDGADARSVAR